MHKIPDSRPSCYYGLLKAVSEEDDSHRNIFHSVITFNHRLSPLAWWEKKTCLLLLGSSRPSSSPTCCDCLYICFCHFEMTTFQHCEKLCQPRFTLQIFSGLIICSCINMLAVCIQHQ